MSFHDFFQQNIVLFVALVVIIGYIAYLEYTGFVNRHNVITSSKLTTLVNDGATLIDVRPEESFKEGHITGAINIPFDRLENSLNTLSKDKTIVLYCQIGQTSDKALKLLKQKEFTKVQHLNGGLNTWKSENLPVTKK